MTFSKKIVYLYLVFLIISIVSILASFVLQRSACVIYNTSGVPCPSCGMTRAFLSILHLDISKAFFFHPLFWLVPFIPLLAGNFKNKKTKKLLIYFIAAVFLAVWVVRLIMFFPTKEPMTFNNDAFLPNFIRFIKGA